MTKGRFITLEGGEGTGKTTQLSLLGEWLRSTGREVVLTREPGGSPQGEALRSLLVSGEAGRWDPISETLLHYAARREPLRLAIVPALTPGARVGGLEEHTSDLQSLICITHRVICFENNKQ